MKCCFLLVLFLFWIVCILKKLRSNWIIKYPKYLCIANFIVTKLFSLVCLFSKIPEQWLKILLGELCVYTCAASHRAGGWQDYWERDDVWWRWQAFKKVIISDVLSFIAYISLLLHPSEAVERSSIHFVFYHKFPNSKHIGLQLLVKEWAHYLVTWKKYK